MLFRAALYAFVLITAIPALAQAQAAPDEWRSYGRDAGGTRFSPDNQITPANVSRLRLAWVFRTGELLDGRGRFEATPILVDGTLYLSTPLARVLALDPASGAQKWSYDPRVDLHGDYGDFTSRGVSTWRDARPGVAACRRRIFVATVDARLIALDGATGIPCADFGKDGTVDLTRDLLNAPMYPGEYGVTSPPAVVGDLVIVGSAVSDNHRTDAPSGVVRAYDARSGQLRWSWDPIPRDAATPGYDTWRGRWAHETGAANAWSVISADPAADMVFVPVGSASPDFFGGGRLGQNLYANSVVALRASTGAVLWHFQVVHHDLWDYDVPAQPVVFSLRRHGAAVPALAVATKMGHVFLLDRRTGTPLFPVEERPVPQTDIPGEETWPTQPFPLPVFRLVPESLPASDAFGITAAGREECRQRIASLRSNGIFTPPSLQGSVNFPGHIGGANWSGVAVDERHGLLVIPTNRLAMVVTLFPRDSLHAASMAQPDLEYGRMRGTPYVMRREGKILSNTDRVLCNPPPWGQLTALDVSGETARVKWQVPVGYLPWLAANPQAKSWGSPGLGGALVTGGGLVFYAATTDQHFRAFDLASGRELWSDSLPAGGHALPMTYQVAGRQYVVLAAGGHDHLPTALGDYVLAYTLAGPGAPTPDTTTHPLAGAWTGELRVENDRHAATVTLRPSGDSLLGELRLSDVNLTGSVVAHAGGAGSGGQTFRFAVTFTYTDKHCGGTISGQGEAADGGHLLVGRSRLVSTCGEHPEAGSFAWWRP